MTTTIEGRALVSGEAAGPVMALSEPLSFWGGVDPHTGDITDVHHPSLGTSLAGKVLVMHHGRGSSSATSVVAEVIRAGVGPVALVTRDPDPIVALGALVAAELYPDRICPVLAVGDAYAAVAGADWISISGTTITIGTSG